MRDCARIAAKTHQSGLIARRGRFLSDQIRGQIVIEIVEAKFFGWSGHSLSRADSLESGPAGNLSAASIGFRGVAAGCRWGEVGDERREEGLPNRRRIAWEGAKAGSRKRFLD